MAEEQELNLIDNKKGEKLLQALESKNYDEAKKLLADPKTNADITDEDDFNKTTIKLAIGSGRSDLVKLILEHPTFKNYGASQMKEYIGLAADHPQVVDVIEQLSEERDKVSMTAVRDFHSLLNEPLSKEEKERAEKERADRIKGIIPIESEAMEKAQKALLQGGRFAQPKKKVIEGIDSKKMEAAKQALKQNLTFSQHTNLAPSISNSSVTQNSLQQQPVKKQIYWADEDGHSLEKVREIPRRAPAMPPRPSKEAIEAFNNQKFSAKELDPAVMRYVESHPLILDTDNEQQTKASLAVLLQKLLVTQPIIDNLKQGRKHQEFKVYIDKVFTAFEEKKTEEYEASLRDLSNWCYITESPNKSVTVKNFLNMVKYGCVALISTRQEHKEALEKMDFYKEALINAGKNTKEALTAVKKVLNPAPDISAPMAHNKPNPEKPRQKG